MIHKLSIIILTILLGNSCRLQVSESEQKNYDIITQIMHEEFDHEMYNGKPTLHFDGRNVEVDLKLQQIYNMSIHDVAMDLATYKVVKSIGNRYNIDYRVFPQGSSQGQLFSIDTVMIEIAMSSFLNDSMYVDYLQYYIDSIPLMCINFIDLNLDSFTTWTYRDSYPEYVKFEHNGSFRELLFNYVKECKIGKERTNTIYLFKVSFYVIDEGFPPYIDYFLEGCDQPSVRKAMKVEKQ